MRDVDSTGQRSALAQASCGFAAMSCKSSGRWPLLTPCEAKGFTLTPGASIQEPKWSKIEGAPPGLGTGPPARIETKVQGRGNACREPNSEGERIEMAGPSGKTTYTRPFELEWRFKNPKANKYYPIFSNTNRIVI